MKLILTIFAILLVSLGLFAKEKSNLQVVELAVTESGFEPKSLKVKPDIETELKVTRKTDSTCSTQIQVPSKNIKKDLPLNKVVSINLGKLKKGEIKFGCGMNMMDAGQIHVE